MNISSNSINNNHGTTDDDEFDFDIEFTPSEKVHFSRKQKLNTDSNLFSFEYRSPIKQFSVANNSRIVHAPPHESNNIFMPIQDDDDKSTKRRKVDVDDSNESNNSNTPISSISSSPSPCAITLSDIPIPEQLLDDILSWLLHEQIDILKEQLLKQCIILKRNTTVDIVDEDTTCLSFLDVSHQRKLVEQELSSRHILFVMQADIVQILEDYPNLGNELLTMYEQCQENVNKVLQLLFTTRFFAEFHSNMMWNSFLQSKKIRFQIRFYSFILPPIIPSSNLIQYANSFIQTYILVTDVFVTVSIIPSSDNLCEYEAQVIFGIPFDTKSDLKQQPHYPTASRRIAMYITDELVNTIRPGDHVKCIGKVSTGPPEDYSNIVSHESWGKGSKSIAELWIIANNVTICHHDSPSTVTIKHSPMCQLDLKAISDPMYDRPELFYQGICVADWLLTEIMMDGFGTEYLPKNSFPKLRLGLLLSLLSSNESIGFTDQAQSTASSISDDLMIEYLSTKVHGNISLLIISDDVIVERFITYAASLHCSHIFSSTIPKNPENNLYVERNGLVLFRNASKQNSISLMQQLHNIPNSNISSLTIWSLCHMVRTNNSSKNQSCSKEDMVKTFDLYTEIIDTPDEKNDNKMADFMLGNPIIIEQEEINTDIEEDSLVVKKVRSIFSDSSKLSTLLNRCRGLKVTIEQEEQLLIRSYFLECRRTHRYPDSSLHTLARFTCAHARLHMRTIATKLDVLVGVMMVEESMASATGTSALHFRALPNDKMNLYHSFDGKSSRMHLKNFARQFFAFIH